MDKTYCIKSVDKKCENTECPRNLNGFYGLYISLTEFNCEEELNASQTNDGTTNSIETE